MSYSIEKERYIYNYLRIYYNSLCKEKYIEDFIQEIRLAILVSENEEEALKMAGRGCYKLLKEYGYGKEFTDLDTPYFDSKNSKKDYLTEDYEESDDVDDIVHSNEDNDGFDMLNQAIYLYKRSKCAKEVCWNLGINYNKKIENVLSAYYNSNILS